MRDLLVRRVLPQVVALADVRRQIEKAVRVALEICAGALQSVRPGVVGAWSGHERMSHAWMGHNIG